jgi:hypothetical protein
MMGQSHKKRREDGASPHVCWLVVGRSQVEIVCVHLWWSNPLYAFLPAREREGSIMIKSTEPTYPSPSTHPKPPPTNTTNTDTTHPRTARQIRERAWALGGMISSKLSKEAQRVQRDMSSSGGGGPDGAEPSAPPFDDFFGQQGRDGGGRYGQGYGGRGTGAGAGARLWGDDGRPPPFNPSGYGR